MERQLSDPQANILDFIERYMRKEGRPPTNREIGHAVGIGSTGHVDYHLTVLEKKGFIARERRKSRGIRLAQQAQSGLRIHGRIAAGVPLDIYADQQQDMLDITPDMQVYALEVQGESMIEDHIADGDYVLIRPTQTANDGEIIVATRRTSSGADGAATLKRFYRERDRVRLQPANSQMEPIYVSAEEWDTEWGIQGVVTAVYRRCQ
jgi:repressor LexA